MSVQVVNKVTVLLYFALRGGMPKFVHNQRTWTPVTYAASCAGMTLVDKLFHSKIISTDCLQAT